MVWAISRRQNVTGANADAVWFVKMAVTVLLPFAAAIWFSSLFLLLRWCLSISCFEQECTAFHVWAQA